MDQLNKMFFDACAAGEFSKVCVYVTKGANVNVKNAEGRSSLMRAAKRGFKEIVIFLIDNGALVDDRDINNKTAIMGAAKKGEFDIVKLLIRTGEMLMLMMIMVEQP